jgi:hypothetical protein
MNYKPQTAFMVTNDSTLVFNLRQDGFRNGRPNMVNDVEIRIQVTAATGFGAVPEMARIIRMALDSAYHTVTTEHAVSSNDVKSLMDKLGMAFTADKFNEAMVENLIEDTKSVDPVVITKEMSRLFGLKHAADCKCSICR